MDANVLGRSAARRVVWWAAVLASAAIGCGDEEPSDAEDTSVADTSDAGVVDVVGDGSGTEVDAAVDGTDASDDVSEDMAEDVQMGVCGPVDPVAVWVISELRFARETGGISSGFDVDGAVSTGADPVGCNKPDLTSPEGLEGVDNQFAFLLPAIEAAGGQALEGLIQAAINEGDILVLLELENLDSVTDDACVSAVLQRGAGIPLLDSNSELEGGQTFARDPEIEPSRSDDASITDGVLEFGPVSFVVPAYVFFYEFQFPVEHGSVRMTFHEDGTASGVMGGGIPLDYLIETAGSIEGAGDAPDALISLAPGLADLFPDESGQCQAVSAALEFEAVPAFFYE